MKVQIAYFSAEFGIDASLPIYSGGLGILAGDHIKSANDLKLSLVGVGILYRKGYFKQKIRQDGTQEALYPELNPNELPLEPVLNEDGKPLLVGVPIGYRKVYLKVWRVHVGTVPVYLMDADHDSNSPADRRLTDSLYGGDQHVRFCQEIILGIGGVRVLRALGYKPDVWHINEGHVALQILERIREYSAQGVAFITALELVKASTVFTTHTAVAAGHDVFSFSLVDEYLKDYYWQLGATRDEVLALGKVGESFNMTRLAVQGSCRVNGVSKLHAQVTKDLFHPWTPNIPASELPIEAITNGIHTDTWLAPELKYVFDRTLGLDWKRHLEDSQTWECIRHIDDEPLWAAHKEAKRRMITKLQLPEMENILTIGFARRFATYKRALLIFRDLNRLERIIDHPQRPVRLIFAGKAHPRDGQGQDLIRRIVEISRMEPFKGKVFFIEDYDMTIAQHMVQGVDVWLNTPLKPLEASGTSGQKAAVNGVLNCSILDGWWAEGYNGQNGWAIIGEGSWHNQDDADANVLYSLLENQITPLYYDQAGEGVPKAWVRKMKESIASLAPAFSAQRMVGEYWEKCYLPTAIRSKRFLANGYATGKRVALYKKFIRDHWHHVQVASVELDANVDGQSMLVRVKVDLGPIWYNDVKVEAVGGNGFGGVWRHELKLASQCEQGLYCYEGIYQGTKDDWLEKRVNVRVLPVSPDFIHDFELELVTWA